MKKALALLLAALLTLCLSTAGLASSTETSKMDQMVNLAKNFLDQNAYPYEYDEYTFETQFAINNAMEYVNVMIYIYDDMLSVSVDAPVSGAEEIFENMAVFTTLANREIYYGQFRVTPNEGQVYISCRSCNLVEDVIPGENELFYLLSQPLHYMEMYGDGICAVIDGNDPYEAFEICEAAVDEAW